MAASKKIIKEARTWVGTPYKHQGRIKGLGVDCVGLAIGVAESLGVQVGHIPGYGRIPSGNRLRAGLDLHCSRVDQLAPGCIILMRFKKEPQHLAIYTDQDTIIHAYQSVGKCVEHSFSDKWKRRVVSYWAYNV